MTNTVQRQLNDDPSVLAQIKNPIKTRWDTQERRNIGNIGNIVPASPVALSNYY